MPVSKAQQRAVTKYMKENYDEIKLRVPKGKKEEIQTRAAADGLSVNAWIGQAIEEKLQAGD